MPKKTTDKQPRQHQLRPTNLEMLQLDDQIIQLAPLVFDLRLPFSLLLRGTREKEGDETCDLHPRWAHQAAVSLAPAAVSIDVMLLLVQPNIPLGRSDGAFTPRRQRF